MNRLKNEEVFKFKKLFENQKREILETHIIGAQELCLEKDDMLDDADMTSTELDRSMRMRLKSRETLFLRKIEEALDRITQGVFGDCESCGDPIDSRRLEARPTATHCVSCKEEAERVESAHIDGQRFKSIGRLKLA